MTSPGITGATSTDAPVAVASTAPAVHGASVGRAGAPEVVVGRAGGLAGSDAAAQVAEAVRIALLDGTWGPGTRLKEGELAARYGVGRHTVRAALSRLQAAGLVIHEPHKGARVRELTRRRIDEVCDFRWVLELGALGLALAHDADLSAVEAAVADLEALDDTTAWSQVSAAHQAVHTALVAASANPRLVAAYQPLCAELEYLVALTRPDISVEELARRHRELLTAVRAGGPRALQALEDDLEHTGRANLFHALRRHR